MTHVKNPSPNLSKLISPYKGQWVALTQDERHVLGYGKTIDKALEMARKKGEFSPFVMSVPPKGVTAFFF